MTSPRPTILLTGFGPFASAPDNASARLVPLLAGAAAGRFRRHRIVAEVLPVDWRQVPVRIAALLAEARPVVSLHFGVSERATGYVVEARSQNSCGATEDAGGALPISSCISLGGPDYRHSTFPARRIVARLTRLGLPAAPSDDAGSYLCNALLYHALAHLEAQPGRSRAGFIHIPTRLAEASKAGESAQRGAALDLDDAVRGGMEIIRTCLGLPEL